MVTGVSILQSIIDLDKEHEDVSPIYINCMQLDITKLRAGSDIVR